MPLRAGQALTHYEILGPLGAGAMGEVYRARDTRLGREVAIKVLPDELAHDAERLRRFEREARALAVLSHAHIAQVYGIDQVGDTCFMAMELVSGEDLAKRLVRGQLSVDEAIDVCRQVAEGLEAAHEAGIVHRDLKPANVCLTPDGRVKLLDFGLAKAAPPEAAPGTTTAETDSFLMTEDGRVLGTPTYMSPEQARGRPVDRRTDAWSFGCLLYECLTGRRAFPGDALADVLAAIVQAEPDWTALPAATPPRVADLLRRCLAKEPRRRLQHLGDARLELELAQAEPPSGRAAETRARPTRVESFAVLAAGLVLGAVATWLVVDAADDGDAPTGERVVRLSLVVPDIARGIVPRIAPDGRSVVYAELEEDGLGDEHLVLHLRRLDSEESMRLPGTERVTTLGFAPDGGSIAVVVERPDRSGADIVRVVLDEGAPRAVPMGRFIGASASNIVWTESDRLVTSQWHAQLNVRTAESDSWSRVPVVGLAERSEGLLFVTRGLPGGRHVLAHAYVLGGGEGSVQYAIDIETGEATRLFAGGYGAYLAPGYLLFTRADTLSAVRFDPESLRPLGSPQRLADGLVTWMWNPAWFDVSRDGTVVFRPGGQLGMRRQLAILDGQEEPADWSDDRLPFQNTVRISRDGRFLTTGVGQTDGRVELWGSEVETPLLRRLVGAEDGEPVPGPIDGERRLVYYKLESNDAQAGVWRVSLDAPDRAERVWSSDDGTTWVESFDLTPDGSRLMLHVESIDSDFLVEQRVDGEAPGEPRVLLETSYFWRVRLSPDGRWLAYLDDEDDSLRLRRCHEDGTVGPAFPVPVGTRQPLWRFEWGGAAEPDRSRLLFRTREGPALFELSVTGEDPPRFSELREYVSGESVPGTFVGLPDGRVLGVISPEESVGEDTERRIDILLGARALIAEGR